MGWGRGFRPFRGWRGRPIYWGIPPCYYLFYPTYAAYGVPWPFVYRRYGYFFW